MKFTTPFRHSLPVPDALFGLPVYVTGVGWERVRPGQPYPFADTTMLGFRWEDGRVLPEFCLAWLGEGAGFLETKQGKQDIPERRAFLFRPGEWHRHRPLESTGWTLHWVDFNGDLPHQWMENDEFDLDGNLANIADVELFAGQLFRLILTAHSHPASNEPILSWQAAGLLSHLVARCGTHGENTAQTEDEWVNRAVEHIWNHHHAHIDVAEVVARSGCSRRTLERRFAKALGRSVLAEIQACRLGRAKRLLAETTMPVKQVVYRAGLRSHQQICLLFQTQLGISPEQYRKQASERSNVDRERGRVGVKESTLQ